MDLLNPEDRYQIAQPETLPPFSTASSNDPTYKNASFYQMQPNGQPAEYLPNGQPQSQPYMPQQIGQPQQPPIGAGYATYGQINPDPNQPYQPTPYQVQGYQPVPMQTPAYMNDPKYQELEKQMAMQSMQNFLSSQKPKNAKWDGVKVFAQKIAPIVGAVVGGGAVGGAMANAQQTALNHSRARKIAEQQQAIDALRATNSWVTNFGMKPLQQIAKEKNNAAKFNASAQNTALGKGYTANQSMQRLNAAEAGRNYRANVAEFGRNRRFDTKENRAERAMAFNQTHRINVLNNHMNEFNIVQDRLQRSHDDVIQLAKIRQLATMRGQDWRQNHEAVKLAYRVQEDMLDHQMDVNKFNSQMELDLGKAISKGELPEGADPDQYMLELQQLNTLNPADLGMDQNQYDDLMNEVSNMGRQAPQQSRPQQPMMAYPPRQGYGDAFTTQGTIGQVAGQPQGMQAVPGQLGQAMPQQPQMQQAPQAIPQQGQSPYAQYSPMFGAPQTQQGQPIQKGVSMKAGQVPQAAQQLVGSFIKSSGNDRNTAKLRLTQSLQKRGMNFNDAAAQAERMLNGIK